MVLKLVPWINDSEWIQVFLHLFGNVGNNNNSSDSIDKIMVGYNQLQVWIARSHGTGLPLSIDCTALLINLLYLDNQNGTNSTAVDSTVKSSKTISLDNGESVRLRYAMSSAIIRLVNGFLDSQQKGSFAKSINLLAQDIGLPRLLVDIRHDATHGELPSLSMLRSACRIALNWLFENYWKPTFISLQNRNKNLSNGDENDSQSLSAELVIEEKIRGALQEYIKIEKKSSKNAENVEKDWINVFSGFPKDSEGKSCLVKVLQEPGFLIPNNLKRCHILACSVQKEVSGNGLAFFQFWLPLLEHLELTFSPDMEDTFISRLVSGMVESIREVEAVAEMKNWEKLHSLAALCFWIVQIMNHFWGRDSDIDGKQRPEMIDLTIKELSKINNELAGKVLSCFPDHTVLPQYYSSLGKVYDKLYGSGCTVIADKHFNSLAARVNLERTDNLIEETLAFLQQTETIEDKKQNSKALHCQSLPEIIGACVGCEDDDQVLRVFDIVDRFELVSPNIEGVHPWDPILFSKRVIQRNNPEKNSNGSNVKRRRGEAKEEGEDNEYEVNGCEDVVRVKRRAPFSVQLLVPV